MNYAFLALPLSLWLGLTLWIRPRPAFVHAGYVGATSLSPSYPAAGIAMAALCLMVKLQAAMANLS